MVYSVTERVSRWMTNGGFVLGRRVIRKMFLPRDRRNDDGVVVKG